MMKRSTYYFNHKYCCGKDMNLDVSNHLFGIRFYSKDRLNMDNNIKYISKNKLNKKNLIKIV